MKKILITGKNSYIGTHLKNRLSQEKNSYYVEELDLHDSKWKTVDFSDYDTIFHVAGLAHSTPKDSEKSLYYKINTDLAYEVGFKAAKEGVHQFIFMSSVIVYGSESFKNSEKIIRKDTPLKPDNFYGDSKKQAEIKLKQLESDQFKLCIIRSPMIYGEGSKGNYPILSKFAKKTPIFPDFENKRSMLYIGNLVEFLKNVIDLELAGLFFPQNEEYVETRKLVEKIASINNHKIIFTRIFNPVIKRLKTNILVEKVFGSLIIDKELSVYNFEYNVFDFEDSIQRTEKRG